MKIKIDKKDYEILDVLSNITIVDSAVVQRHKIGKAHGERKIYLAGNVDERERFFDDFKKQLTGFLLRDDLVAYLEKAKEEYKKPTQNYKNRENMASEYRELMKVIESKEKLLKFKVKKSNVEHSGIYINQDSGKKTDENWNLIGDIALPRISRLSILKLLNDREILYYFKLNFGVVDDEKKEEEITDSIVEKIKNSKIRPTEKEAVILARRGQGKFRKKLLEECDICPFTLVNDEHLLNASHIKPWKDASNREKIDSKNGFLFTPTYDRLFDKGYISFEDDKTLIVSPWISKYNCEKLQLQNGMVLEQLPQIDKKRKTYLEYHRRNILKKLEEL